jgi:hypothetical protein
VQDVEGSEGSLSFKDEHAVGQKHHSVHGLEQSIRSRSAERQGAEPRGRQQQNHIDRTQSGNDGLVREESNDQESRNRETHRRHHGSQ